MKTEIEEINLSEVKTYLGKTDPNMRQFLELAPDFNLIPNSSISLYQSIIESIILQQLSVKAANKIYKRLCNLYNSNNILHPLDILRTSDEDLRQIGISRPKIASIRNLTEFQLSNKLSEHEIKDMTNEEVISKLSQIKGVGQWTAEMILIFKLGRADVISIKDYGLRKGFSIIQRTYPQLPSQQELQQHSEQHWKPYRSIASWYLWRACEAI